MVYPNSNFEDANLFRFWAHEASKRPVRLAKAIQACVTVNDYRVALRELQDTKRAALLSPPPKMEKPRP